MSRVSTRTGGLATAVVGLLLTMFLAWHVYVFRGVQAHATL